MIFILTFFSFFIEAIFSLYIPISSRSFLVLTTLVSILMSRYHFIHYKNYNYFCFIVGLFYDIAFTDTLYFHAFLFLIMANLYQKMISWFSDTWYNRAFAICIIVMIYRILSYFLLVLIGYISLDIFLLFRTIVASLLLNTIYSLLFYKMDAFLFKKHHFKRLF